MALIIAVVIIAATAGYLVMRKFKTPEERPIINISIEPKEITKGGSAVLTWFVENAETCEASSPTAPDLPFKMDWEGNIKLSGRKTYNNIPHDLKFDLSCTNKNDVSVFNSVVLMVKTDTAVKQEMPAQNLEVQNKIPIPSFAYQDKSDGCENMIVFKTNKEKTEGISVKIDKGKLDLSNISKTFNIENTNGLSVNVFMGDNILNSPVSLSYFCNDYVYAFTTPITWEARKGQVTVNVSEIDEPFPGPDKIYTVTIKLNNVYFYNEKSKNPVILDQLIFKDVRVGYSIP